MEDRPSLDGYEVISPLGSGGMGEVWLARDLRLERTVAVKLLTADLTGNGDRVARLRHEARTASALNHPNVCTIHALGTAADGRLFIAMEYVEGATLRERLAGRSLPFRDAVAIAAQVAQGLEAAHAAGVIHRDVKPENVMIRSDGLVKLLDFGLAKLDVTVADQESARTHTALPTTGGLAGTTAYMSPEQARGAWRPHEARRNHPRSAGAVFGSDIRRWLPTRHSAASGADAPHRVAPRRATA